MTTPDGGASWSSQPLTSGSVRGNYRPLSPRGERSEDLDVVWMHGTYPSFTGFQTTLRTQLHSHDFADPSVASWARGRLDMCARDQTINALIHWWQSGSTWRGPQTLAPGPGGAFVPSIASWAARRLDIFSVNASGSLVQYWFDGSRWHGWANRGKGPGGVALSPVQVAADARLFKHLDVFALAQAGRVLAHWRYDGAWHLQNLGTGPDRCTWISPWAPPPRRWARPRRRLR